MIKMRLYHISKTHRGGYIPVSKAGRGVYVGSRKYKIGGYSPLLLSKNLGGFGLGLGTHTPETAKPIISNISKKLENLRVGSARKNVKFLL